MILEINEYTTRRIPLLIFIPVYVSRWTLCRKFVWTHCQTDGI